MASRRLEKITSFGVPPVLHKPINVRKVRSMSFRPKGVSLFSLLLLCVLGFVASPRSGAAEPVSSPAPVPAPKALPAEAQASTPETAAPHQMKVCVIPVRQAIAEPVLYVIRRGLKQAIADKADIVVLDMDTPGGSLKTTFEILEALEKFEGLTITYINKDAISAGALISAGTHEIWFSPQGGIGAAAPVQGGGQDIDTTMKQKIVSYLTMRVRVLSQGHGYRGEVISAMINAEKEFKIGDTVIKPAGELLSLTGAEAVAMYGEPPQKLLGEGIARSIEELLDSKYQKDGYTLVRIEESWSEQLASWLSNIVPLLLGLGLLALFIEFKTPGFGVFGVTGIVLLVIVFLSNYVAGLSGHEPMVLFGVGMILVALEIFVFPGLLISGVLGVILMFGALLWSLADLWPNEPVSFSGDQFAGPLADLGLGLVIAVVLAVVLARFLPKGLLWDRLVVGSTVASAAQISGLDPEEGADVDTLLGAEGLAVSDLRPSGQVEVSGRRYEARVAVGIVSKGDAIRVVGRSDFSLIVERLG